MNLSILSGGAVCPGGFGPEALLTDWQPSRTRDASSTHEHEVFLVDRQASQLRSWEKEPRLRRASPISYYLTEAANQALEEVPGIDRQRIGVVGAFFLGCLVYTVRFYRQIASEGHRSASPVVFPETVFNSPLSHVVSVLGLGGPVYSQVGDTSCWASALRTAQTWLARETADYVLVLGAEEFEPHQLDAYRAGALFRCPLHVGEGAGAVLLGRETSSCPVALQSVHDGFSFTNQSEASAAVNECLENVPPHFSLLDTASGWMAPLAAKAIGKRPTMQLANSQAIEAATASCAWNTILAARAVTKGTTGQVAVPFWGLTQQCGIALCREAIKY